MAQRIVTRAALRRGSQNIGGSVLIALAILGAAFLYARVKAPKAASSQSAPIVVAEFDTINIPVPIEPVAAGTRVGDIRFKSVAYPKHQLPPGTIQDVSAIADGVAAAALPANLPMFQANFVSADSISNPVLERIPPGMRAMTIHVDATSAVEGWAGSGSVVDVLLVEQNRTTLIAEKVKILSAERSVAPVEGSAAPSIPSTVTLLVTQEQCLAINTAIPLGKIAFALRSSRDDQLWQQASFTADRLKGPAAASEPKSKVTGYIKVKGERDEAFALVDGQWLKTEAKPQGTLLFGDK